MAVAALEMERVKRGEPNFDRLEEKIRTGAQRKGVSLSQLSLDLELSRATIPELLRFHKRPGRVLLVALADYFDESREEWQEIGGFDVESLPRDRGYTTQERTVARWLTSLSEEERRDVLRRADEERERREKD